MWKYNQTTNSDELYHYGVLGMKWGRRKAGARSIVSTQKRKLPFGTKVDGYVERTIPKRYGYNQTPVLSHQPSQWKKQREESNKRREESIRIKKAKGMKKAALILKRIGNNSSTAIIDRPKTSGRTPMDEKPHRNTGGRI